MCVFSRIVGGTVRLSCVGRVSAALGALCPSAVTLRAGASVGPDMWAAGVTSCARLTPAGRPGDPSNRFPSNTSRDGKAEGAALEGRIARHRGKRTAWWVHRIDVCVWSASNMSVTSVRVFKMTLIHITLTFFSFYCWSNQLVYLA